MEIPKLVLKANNFQKFNEMQEKCLDKLEQSLVVSAPTASGKTIVAELFMLEQVLNENKKVIYTCPLRALASEHYKDFKKKYPEITFAVSTGDLDSNSSYLKKFDVIFTTYEKLASLLRHKSEWLQRVGCVIVDEIHELDSDRGPVLEIAITQMRNNNQKLKVLGLSATIPNAKELSEWLSAKLVESDFRPVKLREGVLFEKETEFKDGLKEAGDFEDIIEKNLNDEKQMLVFANSRKRAEGLAKKLSSQTKKKVNEKNKIHLEKISNSILNTLEQPTEQCSSLGDCVTQGIAFHHAGLLPKQRELVEENFRAGLIKIICATPTLCIAPETQLWQGTTQTPVQDFDNNNSRILALKKKKLVSVRPQQVVKNYNEYNLVEIESNSGHTIRVTPNHKMLIKRNNKQIIIPAEEINKTDKIATVGKLWKARPQKYKINFFTIDTKKTKKLITPQLSYFIGTMLGDGHSGAIKKGNQIIYKSNPSLIIEDKEIFKEAKKTCKYLEIPYKMCTNSYGTKYMRLTKQKWLREFLVNVGVDKGQNKHICDELKKIGIKETKSLLQGLFDTGGCVEKRGKISFSNISLYLIKDIQRLLLTFGIVTRFRERKKGQMKIYGKTYQTKKNYEITIANKQSIINFKKEISFRIKRKQKMLNKLVAQLENNILYAECPTCNYKIYKELFSGRTKQQEEWGNQKLDIIRLIGKEKKVSSNQIKKLLGPTPYKSEKRLNHHFELIKRTRKGNRVLWELNTIGKKVYYNIQRNQINKIHQYKTCPICRKKVINKTKASWRDSDFEKDVYWDFIREKTIIKEKVPVVYDVVLPDKSNDHLFVANGFIIHNSAGVNTPADIVLIPSLYRYGNYGMELINVREYKQQVGRSGRPKFSTEGKSIVVANNETQKELYMEKYVNGTLEGITSKLSDSTVLRTHVLALIATQDIYNDKSIWKFFEKTLYAKQSGSISQIYESVCEIVDELKEFDFVTEKGEYFVCTPIGKRVSDLFLDPKSAFGLINALKDKRDFKDFSYLYAWVNCNEFFPLLNYSKKMESIMWEEYNARINEMPYSQEKLLFDNLAVQKFFSAIMMENWISEKREQEMFKDFGLAPGLLFNKTRLVEWLAYSTIELSKVLGENRHLLPAKKLSLRVKYGVREELLPLVELRGIGRARARKLFGVGITRPSEIRKNIIKVEQLLGKKVSDSLKKQLKIAE